MFGMKSRFYIFLDTKGTNDHEVSQELRDFLHYVESLDENLVENSDSERLKKIHACVKKIKSSEEMGVKYMQKWEEKQIDREEGREEGREESTLIHLRTLMKKQNLSMEEALSILDVPQKDWGKYN